MKNEKMLDAMGYMDEQFLAENLEGAKTARRVMKMPGRNWGRMAVAAALALVFAVGVLVGMPFVGTAAPEEPREIYENADAVVEALYGGAENYDPALAEKYVNPYIYPVSGSVTEDSFTITVKGAAFDPVVGLGILYYSVENPEGMTDYWTYESRYYEALRNGEEFLNPDYPLPVLNYHGDQILDQANSTDTKLYVAEIFPYTEALWTDTETLTKQAIEAGLRDCLDEILAGARGRDVTLGFTHVGQRPDYENVITITPDPGIGMEWLTFDAGNIRMSPIGLTLEPYRYPLTEGPWEGGFVIYDMRVRFADGTEFVIEENELIDNNLKCLEQNCYLQVGYMGSDRTQYLTIAFTELLDVEQVTALVLNGVEYPVDQYE